MADVLGNHTAAAEAKSVAFIISHTVKAGGEKRYEAWLANILNAVSAFPGYLGREIFRPTYGARKYTSILRFDALERLNAWAESETRQTYVCQVHDLLEEGDQYEIRTGIDFWFTPEGIKPPKRWKQFLLTLSAIYPLSLIVPRVLRPLIQVAHPLGRELIMALLVSATLVGLLTFVVMPQYTRLMRRWLYENQE